MAVEAAIKGVKYSPREFRKPKVTVKELPANKQMAIDQALKDQIERKALELRGNKYGR